MDENVVVTPLPTEAPNEIAAPVAPVPEPETAFTPPPIPGQDGRAAETVLQDQLQGMRRQMEAMQAMLDEYRVAGLSEDELAQQQMLTREQQLAQREAALQEMAMRNEWQNYFVKWIRPEDAPKLLSGNDVVQWNHNILAHLAERAQKAERELNALKTATTKPATTPPAVTTGGGTGQGGPRSPFDMSYKELEALKLKIRAGLAEPSDFPQWG